MLLEQFLSRKSRIGTRLVLGTFKTRESLTKVREWANKEKIQKRKLLAEKWAGKLPFEIKKEDGFLVMDGDKTFPEVKEIIALSNDIIKNNNVEEMRKNKKDQLLTGLLRKESLSLESPYMRLALREDIIGAITKYLGIVPVLKSVDVWYSKSKKTNEYNNSQLHHLDWDAQCQMKIFIYATDVQEESGPLVIMDAASSEKLRDQVRYKYETRVSDETAAKFVAGEKQHPMLGSKGSLIFVDTSRCFHYGSRVKDEGHHRVVALFQYLPPQAFNLPLDLSKASPYANLSNESLPEYQQLVLGAE